MPERIEASVPGKVILMGEHAAVYGRPALVAALDRRVTIELSRSTSGVALDLRTLGHRQQCEWGELLEYRDRKLEAWNNFRDGHLKDFRSIRGGDPAHVVKIALGEAARDVIGYGTVELPPIRITVVSELPVGSGFGSSAAVAVGVVASTLQLLAGDAQQRRVARLAMEVERRQHGNPSGVDHRTVLSGGILHFRRTAPRSLAVADWVRKDFVVFDTGVPAESTGDVVSAVRRRRDRDPDAFEVALDRMEACVNRFERLLASPRAEPDALRAVMTEFEEELEALEVVPDEIRRAIAGLEELGAAGKISGAGALSGSGAGCLLVFRPFEVDLDVDRLLGKYERVEASIGAPGLVVREVA